MGVYRSHSVAPDDGDEDRPRRGRHAAPDDDYPDQEDYPDPGYGGPAAALSGSRVDPDRSVPGHDTTPDSSRRNGTVYGRPRQTGSRDEGPVAEPADAAGDYDSEPYAHSAAGGYGRAAHHSRHDPADDGYQDDFGDNGYRGRYHQRDDDYDDGYDDERDRYDERGRYDDEPPYQGRYDDRDDEPGYN
ncbi:MAG: hypothetical protein ACRDUA_06415, partial [Micromonosporaceae bacterium]